MGKEMPSVSLINYTDIFTKPIFQNQNGEWYRDVGYEDSLDIIRENFRKILVNIQENSSGTIHNLQNYVMTCFYNLKTIPKIITDYRKNA